MNSCLGCAGVMLLREAPERLGVNRREVARLLADGTLVRLDRYLVAGACRLTEGRRDRATHRLRLDALLATYPECAASDESAAVVHDLPLLDLPPYVVGTRPWGAWRGGTSRVRIAPLPPHHLTEVDGTLVTIIPRTIVDLARAASMRQAVVAGDAALRRGCPEADLLATLEECAEWSDVGKARKVLAFLDDRSESVLESVSRVIMHEYDVPPPQPQREICLGGRTYRADFYWDKYRTIGEADGRQKYDGDDRRDPAQVLWEEKVREDALRDAGFRIVRWTYAQMLGETQATIDRITRRLTG